MNYYEIFRSGRQQLFRFWWWSDDDAGTGIFTGILWSYDRMALNKFDDDDYIIIKPLHP